MANQQEKAFWKNTTSVVILAVLLFLSFFLIKPILLSVISGIILAFVFTPLYNKLLKKIPWKSFSAFLICLLFILIILVPLWFVTPILVDQSISIYLASQKINFVTPLQNLFPTLFQVEGFSSEIGSIMYSFVTNITNSVMNMLSNLILNFPTLFLHSLVMFFTFFFVLRDNKKFVQYIQSLLPFQKEVEHKLFKSSKDITFSVIYGQVILGIIQGLVAGISFYIFGVDNALFLLILACVAGIFPIIGTSIIWIPVAIYLLVINQPFAMAGIIAFGIVGAIIENAIKPIFVSKRTNVHSAIILLGMIGGLFFIGILGVIIGPLILSYLLIVLEIYRDKRVPGAFIKSPVKR
jgi:predicted PurR-regulated permease PerM